MGIPNCCTASAKSEGRALLQGSISGERDGKPTPLSFGPVEHPHPASCNFKGHESPQSDLCFRDPREAGYDTPEPGESERKVRDDDVVVHPVR